MPDPLVHRRMRSAHAKRGETCECGRTVYGNGRVAHFRACDEALAGRGWPLDSGMCEAIRDEYSSAAPIIVATQRLLGRYVLEQRAEGNSAPLTSLPWVQLRDLIWQCAEQAAHEVSRHRPWSGT